MSSNFTVVYDACVLYPAPLRDFLMRLALTDLYRARWTNMIHDEWIRNVARDYAIARSVLTRVRKLMDRAAGDALIGRYRRHERLFPKTEAKDRHVAAAAVAARKHSGAEIVTIITWNLADFDQHELTQAGLAVENPDACLCRLLADLPTDTVIAFTRMRDNLRNPAKTTRECANTLAAQGLKKFARRISAMLE